MLQRNCDDREVKVVASACGGSAEGDGVFALRQQFFHEIYFGTNADLFKERRRRLELLEARHNVLVVLVYK